MSRVLVIGNGFDLDLGLKTSYKDFLESKEFKEISSSYNELKRSIEEESSIHKWIDLEDFIKRYTVKISKEFQPIERQKKCFNELTLALQTYLSGIDFRPISNGNAAKVLSAVVESSDFEIFSFNYTDLKEIAKSVGAGPLEYIPIHGELRKGIVLGCEHTNDIKKDYTFVFKSFGKHYRSNTLSYSLHEAQEIIFFGHSFGASDFNYFNRFLAKQAHQEVNNKIRKTITIFTKDYDSLLEIFKNFNEMGINVEYLRADNELNVFFTEDGVHTQEIESYCKSLKDNACTYSI